jgi:TonB family protein
MGVADRVKLSTDRVYQVGSKEERGILKLYDPPELATGAASPASDVWSLGATLVEALTQDLPRWQEAQEDPVLPKTVPAAFLDIAQHCLRRDPERRWTVAEIAARLQQISQTPEEKRRASSPPVLARRRYIVPAAAAGLALAAIVVGRTLVHPRQNIQHSLPSPIEQPTAQEPVQRVPPPSRFRPEADRTTPSSGDTPGEVINQVIPTVPAKARATIQGRVKVSVRVRADPSGRVVDAQLESAGPSKYFANLAMQAARRWKFRPPRIDGRDILSEWILRFEFLNNSTKALAVRVGS